MTDTRGTGVPPIPGPYHDDFTVTVPNLPGQPADHYEGPDMTYSDPTDRDLVTANDPTDDTYLSPNDPTDDNWATGGNTPPDERAMKAARVPASQSYQEYAND